MSVPLLKDYVPFSWISMVQVKTHHFRALAHYYTAVALCDCSGELLNICVFTDWWHHVYITGQKFRKIRLFLKECSSAHQICIYFIKSTVKKKNQCYQCWKLRYSSIQKFGVSKKNTFIKQRRIKLIKSDSKDIYNVTNDLFQINAILLNFPKNSTKWNVSQFQ